MPVEYSFGWKPSPPDFRDVLYAAPAPILTALPGRVDLTEGSIGAPWDPVWGQGKIGACGPHSAVADIVFSAMRQQNLANCPMPSRLFVYWIARYLMGTVNQDSGVDNRSMLKALAKYGWCDEELWPYSDQPGRMTAKPSDAAFQQASKRKIDQFLAVPQNLEQMKGCLASNDPFIFGFSVYQSLMSQETERTGIVMMPNRNERMVGGHDVLMVGYDDATRRFKFRNSWLVNWGDHGYGYMPYEYATNPQLSSDFWTIKHSALPSPIPPPPIPPTPPPPIPTPTRRVIVVEGGNIFIDGHAV